MRKKLEPDWSAINRSFNAKQRRAWNAFHARISILAGDIGNGLDFHNDLNKYPPGHPMERAGKASRELRDEINSIPIMFD